MTFETALALIRRSRLLRVAVIGGMGVVAQTFAFELLVLGAGLRPSWSVVLAGEVGLLTNFLLNNRYSFGDRIHAPLLIRLLRFHTVVAGSIVVQWLCVYTAESLQAGWVMLHVAYVAGILLGFAFNYTGYLLWVWRHTPSHE